MAAKDAPIQGVQSSVVDQDGYIIGEAARKHSSILVNQDRGPCTTSIDCKTEGELTVQMEGQGIGE